MLSMFSFLLYRLHWKVSAVIQMIYHCFRKSSTIVQLNVQAVTSEIDEQYAFLE